MKFFKSAILLTVLTFFYNTLYCQLWYKYEDSAGNYKKIRDTIKVIEFYTKAKNELKKDSSETVHYAELCSSLGLWLSKNRQNGEAEKSYMEAMHIREKILGKGSLEYASSCFDFGRYYFNRKDYEKAEKQWINTKKIFETLSLKEDKRYAALCIYLGNLYKSMLQYDSAEHHYRFAREIYENQNGKEDTLFSETSFCLANLYYEMEQYLKAEPLYREAMQIQKMWYGYNNLEYAKSCANLGNLYKEIGRYEDAEELLKEAIKIREYHLGKGNRDYSASINSLSILYKNWGKYKEAEDLLMATLNTRKQSGKRDLDYAASCNNFASFYRDMGKYPEAEKLFQEAKQLREEIVGRDHHDYASSCYNLGNLYYQMRQYDKAKEYYQESYRIDKKLGNQLDYARSCIGLAAYYQNKIDYKQSEMLYQESMEIQRKLSRQKHPDYASSCIGLGILYDKMNEYKKAEGQYQEAKQILQEVLGKEHPLYGATCNNLASLYWTMDQTSKADEEFRESFLINTKNLSKVFQFTNEKEKAAYIKNVSGEDDNAYSFYVSKKITSDQPYTISLFHRNLILSSLQALNQRVFSANDSLLSNNYNEWIELRKYLSVLYSKPMDERKEETALLEEKAGLLEKELERNSVGFKKLRKEVDWKDIQKRLKDDEAAIEFVSFHFNPENSGAIRIADSILYIALVLRKDKIFPETISLFNEKQLIDLLISSDNKTPKEHVNSIYVPDVLINDSKLASNKIYELIWKPLEKDLKDINTIYFAPSGLLHSIAFAALPVNSEKVLSDRYRLVQLASTGSMIDQDEIFIDISDRVQLYGGIVYNADSIELKNAANTYVKTKTNSRSLPDELTLEDSWDFLPATTNEVINVKNIGEQLNYQNINIFSGSSAVEESFKALNGNASPAVLHIATHGFFIKDPRTEKKGTTSVNSQNYNVFKQSDDPLFRSGLLFAGANNAWNRKPIVGLEDGILTAYEVSNLYLPKTKLAVLSACETALGDVKGNEGVYGLQRAFKIAGVQNLVMSLWKVPSDETSEFMEEFYKNIFEKKSINDAFYNAQMFMKSKNRNDPYNWAAWILVR